jgi:pyridoxamine 5'-phosphate oxidase
MPNLYDTAPAFDEPIAVIRHCHERIRKQLTTLDKLVNYLPDRGVDESVQSAAKAVLKYFDKAARCIIRMKKSICCRHCARLGR